jgi:post-segregation antitoxin (ccd killing protein)
MEQGTTRLMKIEVTVSDDMVREAQARGVNVQEFVESLLDKGLAVVQQSPNMNTAIERIRALRFSKSGR